MEVDGEEYAQTKLIQRSAWIAGVGVVAQIIKIAGEAGRVRVEARSGSRGIGAIRFKMLVHRVLEERKPSQGEEDSGGGVDTRASK